LKTLLLTCLLLLLWRTPPFLCKKYQAYMKMRKDWQQTYRKWKFTSSRD
jgi:hypothetical protein